MVLRPTTPSNNTISTNITTVNTNTNSNSSNTTSCDIIIMSMTDTSSSSPSPSLLPSNTLVNNNTTTNGHHIETDNHHNNHGGRLKFFKDGKFILELERNRDGDKWVSVPRKIFWPPPSSTAQIPTAIVNIHQERATSLSVSDDNSSLQSSPWQRDHCWKQVTPRRGLSKELNMLYVRSSSLPVSVLESKAARLKRRRPLDQGTVSLTNGLSPRHSNGSSSSPETPSEDAVDGVTDCETKSKHISVGKFKFFKNNKCDSANNTDRDQLRVYKKTSKKFKRRDLTKIVDALAEKVNFVPVNAKISALNCKQEHSMVSPRKRILRELERVCLEDMANKRSKPKTGTGHTATVPQAGPSHASSSESSTPKHHNGVSSSRSKPVSSYSISSLLSISDDSSKEDKKPPPPSALAYKTESPASVHSPDLSPSPEHSRRSVTWSRSSPVSYASPASYTNSRPKYFYPEEVPPVQYMYPPYHLPHASYMGAYPGYHHPRPPMFLQFPTIPPGPWAPLAHPLVNDYAPRDQETPSDLPLNLSKH